MADPGEQTDPYECSTINLAELKTAEAAHTTDVL